MHADEDTLSEDGFSLIEVLCAFVILSISAGLASQTIQIATKSIATASEKTRVASLVPRIQLEISTDQARTVVKRGDMDGFHWETQQISPAGQVGSQRTVYLSVVAPDGKRRYNFLVPYLVSQ